MKDHCVSLCLKTKKNKKKEKKNIKLKFINQLKEKTNAIK